jgi:hypothetical protein
MDPRKVCILLTLHCTQERVEEYTKSGALWKAASGSFRRVVTVDSANDQHIKTDHALQMYHRSPSYGEKMSILTAMPSLIDCPFIFKWTGRYYSDDFVYALANVSSDASLVLQHRRDTRGQNSELFGTTLDGLLQILRYVQLKPYVPMERALLLYAKNATSARLPALRLNFLAEQKSRSRLFAYL